jgi:antirestriction protein
MFRIWLGNLGKYNEGILMGEWVDLPCDDLDAVYERIGINFDEPINGTWYEETFIADYESDFSLDIGEYEDLDWLNELAERLEDAGEDSAEIINALVEYCNDIDEALRIYENGNYMFWYGVRDLAEVVEREYEESGRLNEIEKYLPSWAIDWDALANDWECSGSFYPTENGYLEIIA